MNELVQRFVFAPTSEEVRVVTIEENPWFVVMDACKSLGIRSDTVKQIVGIKRVKYVHPNTIGVVGNGRSILLVNESGLYKLIMKSRKPIAEKFQDWVTDEVLPSIRKQGFYTLESKVREMQEALDAKDEELMSLDDQLATTQSRLKWEMEQVRKLQDTIGTYAPFTDMPKGGHARRGSNVNPYHTADAPKTDGSAYRRAIRRSLKCGVIDDYMLDRFRLVVEADLIKGTKHTKDEQRVLELLALGHMKVQTTLSL